VLIQSAIVVIDGVPVSSAVGMHVSDLVMSRLLMKMTASKAVMIEARFSGRRFRGCNESGLKRE
jgi:predicted Co/Zn/Cd cation transporter (cation efflux family)